LPTFLQFENTKKSYICVIFAKKSWVAMKLGGRLDKAGGTGPGLKPPLVLTET